MKFKSAVTGVSVIILAILVGACSAKESKTPETTQVPVSATPVITKDPVNLAFHGPNPMELFMEQHGNYVQKKFSNFSFTKLLSTIEDGIAAGMDIDLIYQSDLNMPPFVDLGALHDLSDLAKKFNFDLSAFEPATLESAKKIGGGKLIALPYRVNTFSLFYNKDLFDRFGVPYPKNGMTWDEVYELAKKLTRVEGGVQYKGFDINTPENFLSQNQYSAELVNPQTNKAALEDDAWKKIFSNFLRFYQIPGNNTNTGNNDFVKGTTAMLINNSGNFPAYVRASNDTGFKWDVVTLPEFSDRRGVGAQPSVSYYMIYEKSKRKEETFAAIMALVSEEVMLEKSRTGVASPLKSKVVNDAFGSGIQEMKDLHPLNMLPVNMAAPTTITKFTATVKKEMQDAFAKVIKGETDINTALRIAAEASDKKIAQQLAK
ncbi:MAG: extracellular solute-binding protein family 1 [Paenibacillus sp.]|nr:extracellular solute-binding protein family 1 [Paenibacillus sp.]